MRTRAALAAIASVLVLGSGTLAVVSTAQAVPTYPSAPPAEICGAVAPGPDTAPTGAVVVPAGDNSNMEFEFREANKTFWFEPGTHTLGGGEFAQIQPGDNATFIGAPGAVINGNAGTPADPLDDNKYLFTQHGLNVTIQHLEITGFRPPIDEAVINHDGGDGWLMEHLYAHHNGGAAVMFGADNTLRYSCLELNDQYGWNSILGSSNITMDHNEITGNNAGDTEGRIPGGCGCSGGGKFWGSNDIKVTNNYVHNNRGTGIWLDGSNYNALIEGNWVENNDGHAIFLEQGYNYVVRNNVIKRNTWVKGKEFADRGDTFPIGTIYISEAGYDARVPAAPAGATDFRIEGNLFEDNWGGIALWENADRFCNSPNDTSTGHCTMVNPAINPDTRTTECAQPKIADPPNYDDCRWKTQNIHVTGNEFKYNPANVTGSQAGFSGVTGMFSNCGSSPDWSPYMGTVIQEAISFDQGNVWDFNTYTGPWQFAAVAPGRRLTWEQWQGSEQALDCNSTRPARTLAQDAGSTFNGTSPAPAPVPPVAGDDTATTAENASVTVDVLANDTGEGISVTSVTAPTSGTATKNADGTITYTPNAGFSGSDSFDYTITDANGVTDVGSVTVTVTAAPEPDPATQLNCPVVVDPKVGDKVTCTYE